MSRTLQIIKKAFYLTPWCIALFCGQLVMAQGQAITGVVLSEDGEELPGVTILVKGTNTGTVTDLEGRYQVNAAPEDILIFSFVGFQSYEVTVGNQSTISPELKVDISSLDEVVVIGYGTVQRKDLTGSVGVVEGDRVAERGTVSPLQGLQGQLAGVDISAGSGRAGAGYNIQIRGQNSLQGGNPLYVVDGVIMDNIDFINPQDIERMDILKDASSTAIYGSRGSNGVVLVTTRQGSGLKPGGTTISYDGYTGVRQNVRQPDFMNGDEWFQFRQNSFIMQNLESGNYDETTGGLASAPYITARRVALKEYTDWPSYFLQTGLQQNHWIAVSGINESGKMNYVIGAGYQEEKGNLLKDWFNKYNFKANVNHTINDQWAAGMSVNLSLTGTERGSQHAVTNAYRMSPLASPYDSLGNLLYQPAKYGDVNYTSSVNPLIDNANSEDNTRRLQGIGNIYLQYSPLDWLDVKTTFSPQFRNQRRGRFFGNETERRNGNGAASDLAQGQYFSYIWDNQVTMSKRFGEHNFNFVGLYSQQLEEFESSFISVQRLPFESGFHNLGSATAANVLEVASNYEKITLMSYMGRLNYSFRDKYLVTVSTRWDGSSKLAQGYKWASFPSAALGWRVSEESFMDGLGFVDDLKLRVGYGFTGNNNIDPYQTQVLATSQTLYDFGGSNAPGFAPSGIANSRLTWERTSELNVGLDYDIMGGRVSGSVDWYNKVSEDLLIDRNLPYETGWEVLTDNIGSVRNRGIEVALTTVNVQTENFSWTTSFNFTKNNNTILELLGGTVNQLIGTNDDGDYFWFVGEEIQANYSYIWDGIWQPDEAGPADVYGSEPGMVKIRDVSGPEGVPDGTIEPNYDRTIIGSSMPSWIGGFSTRFAYKGFDLSASLFTRQGVQVDSPFHREFTNLRDRGRAKLNMNYYMPENNVSPTNISNDYPRPMTPGTEYDAVAYYQDASFIKVQNIQLGYLFPAGILSTAGIKHLRVYANVLNPFVFTDYTGFDPEWADQGLESTGNAFVTYQFGLNLKF